MARGQEGRRAARRAALQMLYQWEVGRTPLDEVARTFWAMDGPALAPADRELALALAYGTVAEQAGIDERIAAAAEHWRLDRMAVMDRLILRLAVWELGHLDTPPKVVINEAIELARTFSTEDAVKFVNGVLDGIRRRQQEGPAQPS
jgi:transcription antitermination protein NusB